MVCSLLRLINSVFLLNSVDSQANYPLILNKSDLNCKVFHHICFDQIFAVSIKWNQNEQYIIFWRRSIFLGMKCLKQEIYAFTKCLFVGCLRGYFNVAIDRSKREMCSWQLVTFVTQSWMGSGVSKDQGEKKINRGGIRII